MVKVMENTKDYETMALAELVSYRRDQNITRLMSDRRCPAVAAMFLNTENRTTPVQQCVVSGGFSNFPTATSCR